MGLLNTTQKNYYEGINFGGYQFTSLEDIIDYFMTVYIGEDKIIPKARRMDVAFHAQRALQELSFDTFKSIKTQQIDLPPSLTMRLPHDYVNYTKVLWADSSGIKHPIYPTKHTQNPFQIKQEDADSELYYFGEEQNVVLNPSFEDTLKGTWERSIPRRSSAWESFRQNNPPHGSWYTNYILDKFEQKNDQIVFSHLWNHSFGVDGGSRAYAAWQKIDVDGISTIQLKATATSGAQQTGVVGGVTNTLLCDYGIIRVGVTITDPLVGWPTPRVKTMVNPVTMVTSPATSSAPPGDPTIGTIADFPSPNNNPANYELGYVEWNDGTTSGKELTSINVAAYTEVWVYIQSFSPWTPAAGTDLISGVHYGGLTQPAPSASEFNVHQENSVDSVEVIIPAGIQNLSPANSDGNSSVWNNYKSRTPSENNNNDYEDNTYWLADGQRYGLDPEHAQVNGSFFIDDRTGKIHFSSNISGKTVILDYISDSLGTDAEMKVHKFAEEAMYKYISHAILSTSSYGQPLVPRLTKEKFAAVRKAKLRLSNIKSEELTQILRGKSKQIKH